MQLIERAIAPTDTEVQIAIRGNEFIVHSPRATISARLLEGRFPEWRKVFPERGVGQQIELAAGPTHAAVRQAAIVTSEESRGIDFTFGDGSLVLAGKAAEVGQSRVELPIGYDGPEITITLDPRFVIDFLKVLDSRQDVHARTERRRQRGRLQHRRRLRLRDHAAGPRSVSTMPETARLYDRPMSHRVADDCDRLRPTRRDRAAPDAALLRPAAEEDRRGDVATGPTSRLRPGPHAAASGTTPGKPPPATRSPR